MNVAAGIGALMGPICIGSFTKRDVKDGWKNFYVSELLILNACVSLT